MLNRALVVHTPDRHTQTPKHTQTYTHTYKHTQTHKHTNTSTQTHKHANTQTHKHTNTNTNTHKHNYHSLKCCKLVQVLPETIKRQKKDIDT